MKLNAEQAEAIVRLQSNPDFVVFTAMIGDLSEKAMIQLINTPGNLEQKQGKCQAFVEVSDCLVKAKQTLQDYQNSK